jgi:hypothetical protein
MKEGRKEYMKEGGTEGLYEEGGKDYTKEGRTPLLDVTAAGFPIASFAKI